MPKLAKFSIKSNELRHKIEIIRYKTDEDNKDNIPYRNDEYTVIRTCRAKIVNTVSEDEDVANGTSTIVTKTFYIRTSRNIEITNDDIVRYNGKEYEITACYDILDNGMFTQITCKGMM